jgi:thiol:disulfide interchange protein DsbD
MQPTRIKRDIGVLYALIVLAAQHVDARADNSQSELVRTKIVAEVESIQPGVPFWLGVHFDIDDSWHLNWLNPGDAGLAPSIKWELPQGFRASELVWPYPTMYRVGPLVIYGYEEELLLITRVTPPADIPDSGHIRVGAAVDWLACAEACVPGGAELSATLPMTSSPPRPDKRWQQVFEQTRRRHPTPAGMWRVQAFVDDEQRYVLEVRSNDPDYTSIVGCRFYPLATDLIDNAEPQQLTDCHGGFDMLLTRAHTSTRVPDRINGVLVADPGWDRSGQQRAISIDVLLQPR